MKICASPIGDEDAGRACGSDGVGGTGGVSRRDIWKCYIPKLDGVGPIDNRPSTD